MTRDRIRIRDPGGPYVEGLTAAFYQPFTAATGIEIARVVGGVEPTGLIEDMVRRGAYDWDMALISDAAHRQLVSGNEALLEPIGIDNPEIRRMPEMFRSRHFIGNDVYATVLAINVETFPGERAPRSWTDFWNVEAFPGRRALRDHPIDTLEEALLADGVAPDRLYPLDLDRAFAALDRVRPHILEWWPLATRSVELMRTRAVDMLATTSLRAQSAIEAGAPFRVVWHQNLQSCEGWVILKGAPAAQLCRRFIAFAATAARQAAFTPFVRTAPTIPGAAGFVDPAQARLLPDHPANRAQAIITDSVYWSREKTRALQLFAAWRRLAQQA